MTPVLEQALTGVDKDIRKRLVASYIELKRNVAEARHETAGLCAGKLCEAVVRHLQQRAHGTHTPFGKPIRNLPDECRKVITSNPSVPMSDSEKAILPRAVAFLYTMRNKRGIGHIGGDVDPNAIDGVLIATTADWIVCELVRIHHGLSLEEAQDLVDGMAIRNLPDVWEVAGKRRVLREGLTARQQSLLLLYSSGDQSILVEDLADWIEYKNLTDFRRKVVAKLHTERLVEWNRDEDFVVLSPKGAKHVEETLLSAQQ